MTAPGAGFADRLSPSARRWIAWILGAAAVVGVLIGLGALRLHLTTDPLADVRAYYDAAGRLNAGLPLYDQPASTDDPGFYRYPPLLAILFRPLALLPYEVAAGVWEALLVAVCVLTLLRLRPRRAALLVTGMLAMPLAWTLSIGQAQALVTGLLTLGTPWAVAFAGHLKLFPWAVGIIWVARRDWRSLGRFAGWILALGIVQLVLEPEATVAFISFSTLEQVGSVANLSPYAISPLLWVTAVIVLGIAAWRLAPTRWGWAAAVALSVSLTPRLLAYQLSTLLAALGGRERDRNAVAPKVPGASVRSRNAPPGPRLR